LIRGALCVPYAPCLFQADRANQDKFLSNVSRVLLSEEFDPFFGEDQVLACARREGALCDPQRCPWWRHTTEKLADAFLRVWKLRGFRVTAATRSPATR
jgi:hypothetical protein